MHLKIHNSVCFKVWLIIYVSSDSYIFSLLYRIKFMFQSLLPVKFWNTAPKRPGAKKSRFEWFDAFVYSTTAVIPSKFLYTVCCCAAFFYPHSPTVRIKSVATFCIWNWWSGDKFLFCLIDDWSNLDLISISSIPFTSSRFAIISIYLYSSIPIFSHLLRFQSNYFMPIALWWMTLSEFIQWWCSREISQCSVY